MKTKILDCTLRDGGYYTNWDFSSDVVKTYIETTNKLPVDYLEVGYRNKPTKEYMGKFGYTPVSILKKLRKSSNKKLAVMLNEKSTLPEDRMESVFFHEVSHGMLYEMGHKDFDDEKLKTLVKNLK